MDNITIASQGDNSIGGDVVGRDKNTLNINIQSASTLSNTTDPRKTALDLCLLADRFKEQFAHIRFGMVLPDEADNTGNIFVRRQQKAGETLQALFDLSQNAKFTLECGEQIEKHVKAINLLFNQYSCDLDAYIHIGTLIHNEHMAGLLAPRNLIDQQLRLYED